MNVKIIRNGKYFSGKYAEQKEYKGWIVGAFMKHGHCGKTDLIEVKYAKHKPGDIEKPHYHKKMIELLIFLKGKAKYNVNGQDIILKDGDFLFIDINNVISGEFLENSEIFAIHSPSIPSDEFLVK